MTDLELPLLDALDPSRIMVRSGLSPDPWQTQMLRSTEKKIILNCSRQSGKSTAVAAKALHRALYVPGSLTLLVAPSLRQSLELFRAVKLMYRGVDMQLDESISGQKIEFLNGSRIVAIPGSEPSNVRGYSGVSLLCIDECAFISDELYSALSPVLAVSKGDIVLLSTPGIREGIFYSIWSGEDTSWERIQVTADVCPRISPDFLASEEMTLGAEVFQSEYFCQFRESDISLFDFDYTQLLVDEDVIEV